MIPSLYIHIPFCRKKCIYCDFYSSIYSASFASDFVNTLINEIKALDNQFSTIYIGGGTPTILEKLHLEKILRSLKKYSTNLKEFTIEANPESLTEEKVKLFLDHGVTRISIGVQSFKDAKLQKLGRIHNSRKAYESVILAGRKGFKNISIDLIYGVWGEDIDTFKDELKKAVELPIAHVSCYALTYEGRTPLGDALAQASIKPLEDETVAGMYETAIDFLSVKGFKQYEVSNFAREGHRCEHNLNYWDNGPYAGLGPSAVSYVGGVRAKNVANVEDYVRKVSEGADAIDTREKLSAIKRAKETAAIKIRTKDGIDFSWFNAHTGHDFLKLEGESLKKLFEAGLIKYKKENGVPSGVCLKRKGFLFSDTVSSAFL